MGRTWGTAVAVAAGVLMVAGLGVRTAAAADPTPVPFSLTPLAADAGYFQAVGSCPKNTGYVTYRWTNASNGAGWGQIQMPGGPFNLNLRMIASAPGQNIEVTVRCHRTNGKATVVYGPTTMQSGVDLLPAPPDSGAGRRIVYSISAQQLWAIEADESVAKTHLVSGRRLLLGGGRSQIGTFHIFRKAKGWACGGGCPNFLGFRSFKDETIGFHQIPFDRYGPYETPSELGQPRSHGCVRQSTDDALWLYTWAAIGDLVVVLP